jgi:hypothetical protein
MPKSEITSVKTPHLDSPHSSNQNLELVPTPKKVAVKNSGMNVVGDLEYDDL